MERLLAAPLLALFLSQAGCAGEVTPESTGALSVHLTPDAAITRGSNNFTMTIRAGALAPTKDKTNVEVIVWMPSMGHGAPNDPTLVEKGDGNYRVEDVYFSMPGTWELTVNVTSDRGNGSQTFTYEIP
ncbi:MAG: FixH family protein [Deltaproteobacteria bacterium]|nr:FixH family protein [Deltaproteobacteria bacterium]